MTLTAGGIGRETFRGAGETLAGLVGQEPPDVFNTATSSSTSTDGVFGTGRSLAELDELRDQADERESVGLIKLVSAGIIATAVVVEVFL